MTALATIRGSLSARAVGALAAVFAGYVLLHERFAAFDARLVGAILRGVGFNVEQPQPGRLLVSAGPTFDVYAVVTGTCSSAAGALGIAAAALVLLPGPLRRRAAGAGLAIALFVALNVLRIVGILGVGWVFATVEGDVLLPLLAGACAGALAGALRLARSPVSRMCLLLGSVVLAVLAYDAAQGYDYGVSLGTYHALAGPLMTFASLALALLVLWRTLVGPAREPATA